MAKTNQGLCHLHLYGYDCSLGNKRAPHSMEGNMSNEMTFRQRTVRIAASAAICGLSISFLIGEAVDQKAKLLTKWTIDPALIPVRYLPTRPIEMAWQQIDSPVMQNQLVALNSQIPAVRMDPRTIRKEFVDVLKISRAAPVVLASTLATLAKNLEPVAAAMSFPAHSPALSIEPQSVSMKTVYGPSPAPGAIEPDLSSPEVEGLLLSIHTATAKLAGTGIQNTSVAPKTEPAPLKQVSVPPVPKYVEPAKEEVIIASGKTTPHMEAASAPHLKLASATGDIMIEADQQPGATWPVRGKLMNSSILKEPGHFEVGIYSKIDSEGVPLGFPLAQQILPAGKLDFQLNVSAKIARGFLFAEFVPNKGKKRLWIGPSVNPWVRGDRQFADLVVQAEDTVSTAAAAPVVDADTWQVKGNVETLFTKAGTKISQADVVVKVRGRREATRTDKNGNFTLDLPRTSGAVYLELLKPGYHPTIAVVTAGDTSQINVQIASREAVDRLASMMGTHQLTAKGVFIGRAASLDGKGLKGLSAQMSLHAEGPFYFTEAGFPTSEKKQTTNDGRFMFFNVEPGSGYVETSINGETIVPIQFSSVEGGELSLKNLVPVAGAIKGRLFNPVASSKGLQPVAGARVRLEGSSDWSSTDAFGAFTIPAAKWIRGEKAALEFSAEKFNNHRYTIDFEKHKDGLNLFAFPANYIRRLARTMDVDLDPYAGIVFGKASGPAIRMDALADHSTVNGAKDFYFDGAGRLLSSHNMTDPKYGTFVIFNVPKGRSMLQGSDSNGKMRYSDSVVASPSSVTVVMD
jgi:hypothetical protein